MKKKLYVCPQTDIQKVDVGILCASGDINDPSQSGGTIGGSQGGPAW